MLHTTKDTARRQ